MIDHSKAVEYLRKYLQDRCGGCGAESYSGTKTYFVASLHGTEFSAWLCTACSERLQNQAAACLSRGFVVVPMLSEEKS